MEIRRVGPADAADYRELRLEALQDSPEAFASSYEEEKEWSVEVFQTKLAAGEAFTFGAVENGKLIGVVTLVKESRVKIRHRASIFAMYVAPGARGGGVGRRLMEEALRIAKDLEAVEQVYLSVSAHNDPAKKLYASLGFVIYGTDVRALKIGDAYFDEDHMVLYL